MDAGRGRFTPTEREGLKVYSHPSRKKVTVKGVRLAMTVPETIAVSVTSACGGSGALVPVRVPVPVRVAVAMGEGTAVAVMEDDGVRLTGSAATVGEAVGTVVVGGVSVCTVGVTCDCASTRAGSHNRPRADASDDILDAASHGDALRANVIKTARKNHVRRTIVSP